MSCKTHNISHISQYINYLFFISILYILSNNIIPIADIVNFSELIMLCIRVIIF